MTNLTNKLILWDFGSESGTSIQQGKRPAYIMKDFGEKLLIIPVTTKSKNSQATHCVIHRPPVENSTILTEQIFQVERPKNLVVIGSLSPEDRQKVKRSLGIAIGLVPFRINRPIAPQIFRGQVFDVDGSECVVIQNNVGNTFSPTTIVADIKESDREDFNIIGIRTIEKKKLENIIPIKELRMSYALEKFIS